LNAKRAFENFNRNEMQPVPGAVAQAVLNTPGYLLNRGIVSIFLRSIAATLGNPTPAARRTRSGIR
jgi:hypothetical protein